MKSISNSSHIPNHLFIKVTKLLKELSQHLFRFWSTHSTNTSSRWV